MLQSLAQKSRYDLYLKICETAAHFDEHETIPTSLNTASELVKICGLSQATISHHLALLQKEGLIYIKKFGKTKYIFPQFVNLNRLIAQIREPLKVYKDHRWELVASKSIDIDEATAQKLIEFISVHGYKIKGPYELKGRSYKYYLRNDQTKLMLVFIPRKKVLEIYAERFVLSIAKLEANLIVKNLVVKFMQGPAYA